MFSYIKFLGGACVPSSPLKPPIIAITHPALTTPESKLWFAGFKDLLLTLQNHPKKNK